MMETYIPYHPSSFTTHSCFLHWQLLAVVGVCAKMYRTKPFTATSGSWFSLELVRQKVGRPTAHEGSANDMQSQVIQVLSLSSSSLLISRRDNLETREKEEEADKQAGR